MNDLLYFLKIAFILTASRFTNILMVSFYKMIESNLAANSVLRLNCFIYDKILKASLSSNKKKSSQGEIINYILVDSARLKKSIKTLPGIIIFPVQIAIYVYFIFYYLGISFLFGLIPITASFYINYNLFKQLPGLQTDYLRKKDERMGFTSETIDELKLLKMYSWEGIFENKVLKLIYSLQRYIN